MFEAENAVLPRGNSCCIEGTRTKTLDEIYHWVNEPGKPVYWLKGSQGTGKSTIARAIAEKLDADGRLGDSFVCSRESGNQRDFIRLFTTLAFLLAWKTARFRDSILASSHQDLERSRQLAIHLSDTSISTVFVIDAFDESMERDECDKLTVLSFVQKIVSDINPNIKFFIAGRPEMITQTPFPCLESSIVQESSLDFEAKEDVQQLFEHNMEQIDCSRNGLGDWPAAGDNAAL